MKAVSSIFSRIAGIVATILSVLSLVGLVIFLLDNGFSTEAIKPLVMFVLFLISGSFLVASKHGIMHVIACIIMIVVILLELFVWIGGIFAFVQMPIYLIFNNLDVIVTVAKYYQIILYVLLGCSAIAMAMRIFALVVYGRDD